MKKGLKLNPKDNVGVVLENVRAGEPVDFGNGLILTAHEDIMTPHKMALCDMKAGEFVIKYGEVMGYATQDIRCGDFVHVHNCDYEKIMR